MAVDTYTKVNGVWRKVVRVLHKDGGAWEDIEQIYTKTNSTTWKRVFQKYKEGSLILTEPGTYEFVVPYFNTMSVACYGAGGGGGSSIPKDQGRLRTPTGGTSSFGAYLSAVGGEGGQDGDLDFGGNSSEGARGSGGIASGGSVNTNGSDGQNGDAEGSSTGGGAGGRSNGPLGGLGGARKTISGDGNPGASPGGGGSGSIFFGSAAGGGGGGGAYTSKSFSQAQISAGSTVIIVVGLGSSPSTARNTYANGGKGGDGRVEVYWS